MAGLDKIVRTGQTFSGFLLPGIVVSGPIRKEARCGSNRCWT